MRAKILFVEYTWLNMYLENKWIQWNSW